MSLGHKQLEENPWEVFETIFAVGSSHNGTVLRIDGNQALVALPYGLEGSCHTKHLQKEDGSSMLVDESGDFTVLEFNRNAKRITVSHLRTHEEGPKKKEVKERKPRPATGGGGGSSSRALEEINATVEKSTFGDLSVLSALKEQMEGGERKAKADAAAEATAEAAEAAPKKKAPAKAKAAAAEAPAAEAPAAEPEAPEPSEGGEEAPAEGAE
jgi:small subunit ribosomal protein S1